MVEIISHIGASQPPACKMKYALFRSVSLALSLLDWQGIEASPINHARTTHHEVESYDFIIVGGKQIRKKMITALTNGLL